MKPYDNLQLFGFNTTATYCLDESHLAVLRLEVTLIGLQANGWQHGFLIGE
jgi:hypothetical protein